MPELPEVESYRRLAAKAALGREITEVDAGDSWYLKGGTNAEDLGEALIGSWFVAARRRGKLLLLDTNSHTAGDKNSDSSGDRDSDAAGDKDSEMAGDTAGGDSDSAGEATLGLRFGMSGRLVVDGSPGVDRLLYSPAGDGGGRWVRFSVRFADGGIMAMDDPRRLGGVELNPDESGLGPDAMTVTVGQLKAALAGSAAPLKARLMDQARLAGVGNLIADEVLWRAGLSPQRPAGGLSERELRRLRSHLRSTIEGMIGAGSHTGRLMSAREVGGICPRDGTRLTRSTVGGRTSWWCPTHQH